MEKFEKRIEHPTQKVLNEAETIAFLKEQRVASLENWSEGEPVLYVFPERFRKEDGALATMVGDEEPVPESERPTIARIDSPESIDLQYPIQSEGDVVYELNVDEKTRVDYFVIDAAAKKPRIVRSTTDKSSSYRVRREALFVPNDTLFPRGNS